MILVGTASEKNFTDLDVFYRVCRGSFDTISIFNSTPIDDVGLLLAEIGFRFAPELQSLSVIVVTAMHQAFGKEIDFYTF